MSNPSKAKGTRWETEVLRYLKSKGIEARRMPPMGSKDEGDLRSDTIVWECKATKAIELAKFVDEATTEAKNATFSDFLQRANGQDFIGVTVVKRRMKGVDQAYVVMRLCDFVERVFDV